MVGCVYRIPQEIYSSSPCTAHSGIFEFNLPQPVSSAPSWFLFTCIVTLVLLRHYDIHNALLTCGCRLEYSIVYKLRKSCQQRIQVSKEGTFGVASRTPFLAIPVQNMTRTFPQLWSFSGLQDSPKTKGSPAELPAVFIGHPLLVRKLTVRLLLTLPIHA